MCIPCPYTGVYHVTLDTYLRPYDERNVFIMERRRWDNTEVYNQMLDALTKTKTPVYTDFDGKTVEMGDFSITFYYCGQGAEKSIFNYGENINTVVTLVECNGTKILLAGDMNYKAGDERRIAKKVGKVNLLKVGHHGVFGSTSSHFYGKSPPILPWLPIRINAFSPMCG